MIYSTYEDAVKRAKELGFQFERQRWSTVYDVRDNKGKWLCFDHNLADYLEQNGL